MSLGSSSESKSSVMEGHSSVAGGTSESETEMRETLTEDVVS